MLPTVLYYVAVYNLLRLILFYHWLSVYTLTISLNTSALDSMIVAYIHTDHAWLIKAKTISLASQSLLKL